MPVVLQKRPNSLENKWLVLCNESSLGPRIGFRGGVDVNSVSWGPQWAVDWALYQYIGGEQQIIPTTQDCEQNKNNGSTD